MRRSFTLALIVAITLSIQASSATAGTFDVTNCSSLNRSHGGTFETTNAFSARSLCSDAQNDHAIKIESVARATQGRSARVFWEAPEDLSIVGVEVEGNLRRANGFKSVLYMADGQGRVTEEVANGNREPSDFETFEWTGSPQRRFVASLECAEGPSCDPSTQARTWLRNITFTVRDDFDPEIEVGGSLFEPGWTRGEQLLTGRAEDLESGVLDLEVRNGTEALESLHGGCPFQIASGLSQRFQPCASFLATTIAVDTTAPPFVNGNNTVLVCGQDFAAREECVGQVVQIDNLGPELAFSREQDPFDPELITVGALDPHSGVSEGQIYFRQAGQESWQLLHTQVASGAMRARVDSTAVPPGAYEFRAQAIDVAGNTSETTVREDGTPMILQLPLKSGVDLTGRIEPGGSERTTVNYGRSARAQGRLLDAAGAPMPNQSVTVDEDFGEGALIDHRTRTVMTDEAGRWSSKLPAGPSRRISVAYAGDQRYLADGADIGLLSVKTGARLGVTRSRVPEGRATTFRGRIGRLGARIPPRGKNLQLQYQDPTSGRWLTVRNPFRSRSNGRFKFNYKFGTHYEIDVSIRFRLKVPAEQGWPYRGTHTQGRRVIVQAR